MARLAPKVIVGIVAIICVAAAIAVAYFWPRSSYDVLLGSPSLATTTVETYTGNTEYRNETYQFSIDVPKGFAVRELPSDTASTIAIENRTGDGIQIIITKQDEDVAVLTQEMIALDIPDMQIRDAQPVIVGQNHTGLAFESDNPSFGGASREVWFYFNSNLYQISTYARLDPLLKSIFATWQFY